MKKLLYGVAGVLILSLLAIVESKAEAVQFKLAISGTNLIVSDGNGAFVSSLGLSTIGQTIIVPPVSFQISYGRDARGNYSAVVSPNPDKPDTLSFEALGSRIELDKTSIVTATFSTDGKQMSVDPGFVGEVKLNGTAVTSSAMVGSGGLSKTGANVIASPMVPSNTPSTVNTLPVATMDSSTPDAIATTNASDSSSISLAADFKVKNPKVKVVVLDSEKQVTQTQLDEMLKSHQVAQKEVFWAEPVTPPNASEAMAVAPTEMKMAEVKGDVKVTTPQGKTMPAKDGMTVDANSKFTAGENSSAAVMIGGVDSVRLTSSTMATIGSSVAGGTRTTVIELKEGILFNKVGQRDGEKQDFKVLTPAGVASARGTDFSTTASDGRLVVLCVQGAVETFDSSNKLIGTAAPKEARSLSYVAVGSTTNAPFQQTHDMLQVLASAFQINAKVNALLESQASGQKLTPVEQAYLKKVAVVDLAIAPTQANAPLLLTILPHQLPPPSLIASIPLQSFNFSFLSGLVPPPPHSDPPRPSDHINLDPGAKMMTPF